MEHGTSNIERRACRRSGATEILVVALIAAVGIGLSAWRSHGRRGLQVERRYRPVVEQTMRDVSDALGLEWEHENIRVVVVPGEKINEHGYWARWIAHENDYVTGWAEIPRSANVVVCPVTRELPGGIWSVLGHELAHLLLDQHGIKGEEEHHRRMRAAGIKWAQL